MEIPFSKYYFRICQFTIILGGTFFDNHFLFNRTVHRKYNTVKNGLSVYVKGHRPVERDPSDPSFQSIANKYHHDPAVQDQRSRQRMRMREERLRARD